MPIFYSYPKADNIEDNDVILLLREGSVESGEDSRMFRVSALTLNNYMSGHTGDYVPYIGATEDVELGTRNIITTGIVNAESLAGRFFFDSTGMPGLDQEVLYNVNGETLWKPLPIIPIVPSNLTGGIAVLVGKAGTVTNTDAESNILDGEMRGTLSIPENSLLKGDSFELNLGAIIDTTSNANINIRLTNSFGIPIFETGYFEIADAYIGSILDLKINFTVRAIGGLSSASVVSMCSLIIANPVALGGKVIDMNFLSVNDSNFDTTSINELLVSIIFSKITTENAITTELFNLSKTYTAIPDLPSQKI